MGKKESYEDEEMTVESSWKTALLSTVPSLPFSP